MIDVIARASGPLARGSDTPAHVSLEGGGSGANVAAWAAALGTPVCFACRVGDDLPGRRAVDTLLAAGAKVHAAVDRERPTGTCVVLVEPGGERTMLPDPGANDAPVDVPDAWLEPGRHLHVVGYALLRDGARPGALAAIERAQAAGMTVSVDPAPSRGSTSCCRTSARPRSSASARTWWSSSAPAAPAGTTSTSPPSRSRSSTPPAPATRSPPGCSRPAWTAPTVRPP
jgi:sugar/nucleoside kinase (ribokinase family)